MNQQTEKPALVDTTTSRAAVKKFINVSIDRDGDGDGTGDENTDTLFSRTAKICCVVALLGTPPLYAQNDANQNDQGVQVETEGGQTDDSVTLNIQDADIRALINTVSQLTGENFVVDPRVKGKVTVVSGEKLSADQIYDVFLSVLEVHNFSAVPSGSVIKILPSNIVKQRPTPIVRGKSERTVDEQITQVYQLKHSSVQEMVPILRPLLPPTSHFAAHAPTNTLVFTDTGSNIQRIIEIIEEIDQPDRRSDIHVVYLKNARASVISKILAQLVGSLKPDGGPEQQGPISTKKDISIQSDDSLNAIIIQSPETEFRLIQAVIEQLDIERPAGGGDIHVIYLRYANAKDLVTVLNNVISSDSGAPVAEGAAVPEAKVTVEADEDSNALIVRANPEKFAELQAVVAQLDKRRSQVFVETIIAEVTLGQEAALGVSWNSAAIDNPTDRNVTISSFSDGTGGTGNTGNFQIGFLNGLTSVINAAGERTVVPSMRAVLTALRGDNNTNIISTPNLLTLDNETASITVGQNVPFVTGDISTGASDTSTDENGNTVSTPQTIRTIERQDVGVKLEITPQINEGDTIQLEVNQEISNVAASQGSASDIITSKRAIEAMVQVDDGQIIVLGGLIEDDVEDTVSYVPVLGEIPLIGNLFKKKTKSAVKTNLMVFLRPKIVRTPEDLAALTESRYRYMQGEELRSQPATDKMIRNKQRPLLPPIDRWSVDDAGK